MKKGFTLIEMLIAIVVIGMIVGILVGIFGNPIEDASIETRAARLVDVHRLIADAEDYHFTMYGTYATREELLSKGILKSWPTFGPDMYDETDPTCIGFNSLLGYDDFQYHVIPQHAIPDGTTISYDDDGDAGTPAITIPLKTETYIASFCPKPDYGYVFAYMCENCDLGGGIEF